MRARILEINEFTLVLKDEKKRFLTIDKERLKFEYQLGDTVEVEKGDDGRYKFRVYGGNEPLEGEGFEVKEPIRPAYGAKKKRKLEEPIGGLLLAFTIILALSILWRIIMIPFARTGACVEMCMTLNADYNNSCAAVDVAMKIEYITPLLLSLFDVFVIARILAHRKVAKILAIIRCILWPVCLLLVWNIYSFIDIIHHLPEDFYTEVQLNAVLSMIGLIAFAIFWILYFTKSERVKYTLTK